MKYIIIERCGDCDWSGTMGDYCNHDEGPEGRLTEDIIHPDCPLPDLPETDKPDKRTFREKLRDFKPAEDCPECGGSGVNHRYMGHSCYECNGTGKREGEH